MVEFNNRDSEFNNFLKAADYVQSYTRLMLEKSAKKNVRIPETLTNINQLTQLVQQFLGEQRELAARVGRFQEDQGNFNDLVKTKLDKCDCEMKSNVKQMMRQEVKLEELKKEDGSEFLLKIPTNSSSCLSSNSAEFDSQPRIDLELLKMMECVSSPFHEIQQLNGHSHSSEPTLFESPEPRKMSVKPIRRRPVPLDTPIGPYQCSYCDKTFRQKHGLSQHLLTHESNGAFECDGCGKRYSRPESVNRHKRSTLCSKYQTLTNVRHDEIGSPSMTLDLKDLTMMQPSPFLL